jgi:hypothetical protein
MATIPETVSHILQINGRLKFSSKEKNQHFLSGLKAPLMMEKFTFYVHEYWMWWCSAAWKPQI